MSHEEALKQAELLASRPVKLGAGGPCTAEVDENGVVVIKDRRGNPIIWLPLSDYLALKEQEARR